MLAQPSLDVTKSQCSRETRRASSWLLVYAKLARGFVKAQLRSVQHCTIPRSEERSSEQRFIQRASPIDYLINIVDQNKNKKASGKQNRNKKVAMK